MKQSHTTREESAASGDVVPIEVAVKQQGGGPAAINDIKTFIARVIGTKSFAHRIRLNKWTNRLGTTTQYRFYKRMVRQCDQQPWFVRTKQCKGSGEPHAAKGGKGSKEELAAKGGKGSKRQHTSDQNGG